MIVEIDRGEFDMTTEEIKKDILQCATNLMAHIRVMLAYLDTYKALCDSHKEYHNTMCQAPLFFNIIEKSLISALMIDLCKLFEENKDVFSVKKLYNICEQNQRYFSKYREEDGKETAVPSNLTNSLKLAKEEFERNKEVISNLKSQRDTLWAHHDKRWFLDPNKIENNHPIMWQDIEALLHFASDFTNCVILNFSSGIEFPFFNSKTACFDDVQKMLSLMERGINETK